MKKIIALAIVAGLGLAGCNTVAPVTNPTATTTQVVTFAKQVEDATVAACKFLPAATTVATIVSASPSIMTATQIAQLICSAVTKTGASRTNVPTLKLGGKSIVVDGRFVK